MATEANKMMRDKYTWGDVFISTMSSCEGSTPMQLKPQAVASAHRPNALSLSSR